MSKRVSFVLIAVLLVAASPVLSKEKVWSLKKLVAALSAVRKDPASQADQFKKLYLDKMNAEGFHQDFKVKVCSTVLMAAADSLLPLCLLSNKRAHFFSALAFFLLLRTVRFQDQVRRRAARNSAERAPSQHGRHRLPVHGQGRRILTGQPVRHHGADTPSDLLVSVSVAFLAASILSSSALRRSLST